MYGSEGAIVSCVHGLEHIQSLSAATLSNHDPIGAHTQGIANQIAECYHASALHTCRLTFQADDVLLIQA
jgi:hypothetical protein